ncbi:MAG: MgtC/SapB family protein [Clostridia bacterium]|nr:MgtC/SapB family protein [Clostridia bacterium]
MLEQIYDYLLDFNSVTAIIRLVLATILGGLIGSERGRHGRPAGLRTHILICVGAAMSSVTSMFLSETLGSGGDIARISAQVISGIGFLGAGTIMVRNSSIITGLTTAAGMWATAAIGIAAGYGFYVGAIVATFICIFSVTILSRLEHKEKNIINVYLELTNIAETEQVVDLIYSYKNAVISYNIIPAKSGNSQNVGIIFVLHGQQYFSEIKKKVCEISSVAMFLKDIAM